jgi:hypothetical protein
MSIVPLVLAFILTVVYKVVEVLNKSGRLNNQGWAFKGHSPFSFLVLGFGCAGLDLIN